VKVLAVGDLMGRDYPDHPSTIAKMIHSDFSSLCIFQTCLKKKETHQSFNLKKDTIRKNISKITETFN